MMYSMRLGGGGAVEVPPYDPIAILRELNYFPFVNGRNKPKLADALRDDTWKRVFCDMSAAATTQLYYRDMIDIERVWKTVAFFFHQAIQMRGFEALPDPENFLDEDTDVRPRIELLVAGTQEPDIYRSRVDGCLQAVRRVAPPRCRITFSGANPSKSNTKMGLQGGVRTLNEAADMELYFRQQIARDPLPPTVHYRLQREMQSESTQKNIEYFFQKVQGDDDHSPPMNVFVVSSLYHLPRFIDLTMQMVREHGVRLDRITFVSAEDPLETLPAQATCPDYIKSCMFEFYWQLYSNTDPAQICQLDRE